MKTKIFCDIADFKTIKFFNTKSIVDGFTTNPSLMRLAGAKNYKNYSLKILKVCKKKPNQSYLFLLEEWLTKVRIHFQYLKKVFF